MKLELQPSKCEIIPGEKDFVFLGFAHHPFYKKFRLR